MKSPRNMRNPYIIGRSIYEPEMFFGRESLFRFIEDNLSNNQQVILLHGQRRIGKSSILEQIPQKVNLGDEFVFIPLDFQDKNQFSLHQIIYKLAQEIVEYLEIDVNTIDLALIQGLEQDVNKFRDLLRQIFQKLGNINLVLLLDEFDVADNNNNGSGFENFFQYLHQIVYEESQLFIIPVVGRRLSDMPTLLKLFKGAPHLRIGLLDKLSTQRLIKKPAEGYLKYHEGAIDKIIELSAGHPYFTQAICYALFAQARELKKDEIQESDVSEVVDNAIELSEAGLVWFRDGLSIPEKVVFSAAAQEKARQKNQPPPENPLNLLEKVGVQIEQLRQARQTLTENDFLDADRVTVEFVRRWLLKFYPLKSEISELEKLDNEASYYYERADIWRNRGDIDDELYHYRKALELNPNHFSALFSLAEAYRKNQKFQEASKLYERAYKINPQQVKKEYIESLLGDGNNYFRDNRLLKRNLSSVKKLYEKILEIDPNNTEAVDKLNLIAKQNNVPNRRVISAALAVPILIGIGIFLGQKITNLPFFQPEKGLSFEENEKRFSRGENTVFSEANNEDYSKGILNCNQKFQDQQKNYNEVANCFDELTNTYRNEPELLIYKNNYLARNRGNPLTIAVVVPADNNSIERAKDILRGVAQAQNEYNEKLSQNNRLLEIIIANDSNDPEFSEKIAQEIVEEESILGVIGHNSSNATKAALEVYEAEKLPVISPTSTSTELNSSAFFRTVIDNSVMTKNLAEYIQSQSIEKIVIFYNEKSIFSKSLKEFFDFYLKKMGSSIQVESIDLKEPSFNINTVQTAANQEFKIGMLFSDLGTIDLAIEIAKANFILPEEQQLRLFGGDTLYSCDTLKEGKQALRGLILAVPWFKELPAAQPFVGRAIALWGEEEVDWRTATSYDATKAFIDALSNSGDDPTGPRVLAELQNVNLPPKETSGQNLRFDPNGEIIGEAILVEVVESPNPACSNLKFDLVKEEE